MNALYLTYAILAAIYFLLQKKWNTKWLRQGNYLFLAVTSLVMLFKNSTEIGMAYFMGYLGEMLRFFKETTGSSYLTLWASVIILPLLGLINFNHRIRNGAKIQFALLSIVIFSLVKTAYQYQSLEIFFPFEFPSIQRPNGAGWHTTIGGAFLPLFWILFFLPFGAGISTFLGWFLKRRHERRQARI